MAFPPPPVLDGSLPGGGHRCSACRLCQWPAPSVTYAVVHLTAQEYWWGWNGTPMNPTSTMQQEPHGTMLGQTPTQAATSTEHTTHTAPKMDTADVKQGNATTVDYTAIIERLRRIETFIAALHIHSDVCSDVTRNQSTDEISDEAATVEFEQTYLTELAGQPTMGAGITQPTTGAGMARYQPTMGAGIDQPTMGAGSCQPTTGAGIGQPTMGAGLDPPTTGVGAAQPTTGEGMAQHAHVRPNPQPCKQPTPINPHTDKHPDQPTKQTNKPSSKPAIRMWGYSRTNTSSPSASGIRITDFS